MFNWTPTEISFIIGVHSLNGFLKTFFTSAK